jgi:uncharacterized membrane protein
MADFTESTRVNADETTLFDYLSDVSNLPTYFARMTDARPGDGEEVHTTAKMPDGQVVQEDAWFRIDQDSKRIEWGSEGESGYHGHLEVTASGEGAEVEVHVHTERVSPDDSEVSDGIRETLTTIKRIVEQG